MIKTLSNPKLTLVCFLLLSLFSIRYAQAATITSTATGGAWATTSTWVGGVVPATGDSVIIATTGTNSVSIAASITQTAAGSVTVNAGAILNIATSGVTVTFGSVTVASGGTLTIKRNTTILGTTTISGRINFGSTSTSIRTITFTGVVTLNSGAIWDETNAATNTVKDNYVIKNNFVNNATTFTPLLGSPHNFTGAGTLSGATNTVMPTATFTAAYINSGTLIVATLLTVTGVTLTNNGTITASAALSGTGGVTQGTTGILNVGGASAITTLTATAAGNTVNYTGAAQTIHTGNYSNLNFSGSGAKTLAVGTTTIGALSLSGTATTTTVVNLAITNNLTINTGTTFTTGATFTQSVGGTTSVTGSLVLGGTGAKTFTGDVTLNAGGVWNETGIATINYGGALTNNATTFTANTGGHNFTGSSNIISGGTATSIPTATFTGAYTVNSVFTSATLLTITGVTVTNNSTMTATTSLAGTGNLTQGAAGLLNIGGAISLTTLNAAAAGNTVNYTGAAQTGFVTTYSNLTLSGTLAKTFATTPTVNAVLSMEGTATISIAPTYGASATLQYNTATARTAGVEWNTPFVATGGIIIKNTGAITTPGVVQIGNNTSVPLNINAGATLTPGANLITFHGDFINAGTLTSGSGGITIGGTVTTQSIAGFTTTGTVTLTKTAGTATLGANANGGPLTINGAGGTLNLGVGFTHTFTGIVTLTAGTLNGGSSTLNENAVSTTAWTGTGSVFVPSTSTVNFGAAGNQTIAANSSFYNLALSSSGTKTFSNATTINNSFSASGTAVANLGTGFSHTAISIALGGASQVIGTWGSTASSALNKNATWFGTTATGTINVSCVAPSVPTSGGNQTICSGATIPALTVSVGVGQVVDWYNQSSGGTLLASSTTSYTPSGAGTYYAETRLSSTGCLSATRIGVTLTVNPLPVVLLLTGSTICASPGGNGTITSTTSVIGINYQLYNASNVAVQAVKAGTSSALTWSTLAAGAGYYVKGTNATTGCASNSSTVNVATNPNPTALILTGSTICTSPGGDGTITSSTSQIGVDYQLYDSSNVALQPSEPGTGGAITWDALNAGTGYYVKGTNTSTGCISSNSNTVNVSTIANPIALVLTGSTICASPGSDGTITSTTSVVGVDYQLNESTGTDIGSPVSGTGAALTFTGVTAGTGYYVDGYNTTTGCIAPNSNAVDVLTNANPSNKTITVSLASVCTGTGANVIIAGSLASESYQLRNNTGNTNIGSPVTGNGASLNLPTGNLSTTTTFNVLVTTTATGCTSVMTTTPTISITPANTASAASSTPSLCINAALTAITHTTTGATGIGTATGLPTGVTAAWASNTITISGTPSVAGTFNYSIPLSGGCGTVNAIGTITVTPNKTTGAASSSPTLCINTALTAITHTTTGATGIGTATGLPTGVSAAWASNTITISGTPTASGIFNYSIPLSGGCGTLNATGTITVTPNKTAGTASSSPTLCINTALTAITHTTTGATGIGTASGLPSGVSAAWASNTITISGTPTASGTFNYSIPLSGGCGAANATGTITVTPNNTAGVASSSPTLCINTALTAITHTTTGATGIGTASGLPSGVSAAWASNTITISGTPTASGTFNYSIPLSGGCGTVNASGTITVTPANAVGAASSTPTLCINTALTAITHTTTAATGIGTATGLPAGVTAAWASNTITISGTPAAAGTFNYSIPLSGGCGTVNATGTITVTPNKTAGAASSTPTLCINTALSAITHTTTGATGIGTATGLPAGVTAAWASNTITISGTPTASGTFSYNIPLSGGCGTVNASGIITIIPATVGGTVSGSSNVCAGSSSGALSLSGQTGTVVRWESAVSPFTTWTPITNTTTSYNSGILTQTTKFRAVVQSGSCGEATSTAATIGINTTTWVSGAWSNGAPDATTSAIISDSFVSGGTSINACSLTVNSNATVVISSGDTVNLSGALISVPGSFITFNNNANLIQGGTTNQNSGGILIKRNSAALKRQDYEIWSSPVASQQLLAFSPQTLTNRFYTYNTNTNLYDPIASPSTTNFDTAKGYLIRMPNNHPTTATIWTGQFVGVPNNGDYSFPLINGGVGNRFNLVGNPYPSPIDLTAFIGNATNNNSITGTLYFWRKTNASATPSYCTWNLGGFVGNGDVLAIDPNDVLQTGQGFFVEGTGVGSTVVFDNSMRINNHTNQFFKSAATVERNRIWLNATNADGLFSQTMVGYVTNATQDYDSMYDGKFINTGDMSLSSLIGTIPFAIQSRALPFADSDVVPLSFKATTAGSYSIAIDHVDGLFTGSQGIYLRDNLSGTIFDLHSGAYNFISEAGNFDSRFELVYQSSTLGVVPAEFNANHVILYKDLTNNLIINTGSETMSSVKVFDLTGKLLVDKKDINSNNAAMNIGIANEVVVVQIISDKGVTVTKKFLVQRVSSKEEKFKMIKVQVAEDE